jgi:hypothetical protein
MLTRLRKFIAWRKRRMEESLEEERQEIFNAMRRLYRRLYWWRWPPPEGWAIGYTCNYLPPEAVVELQTYGCITPPTAADVDREISRWRYLPGLRVQLPSGAIHRIR